MRHKHLQKSGILCLSFLFGITMLMTGCGERTDGQMQSTENHNTAETSPDTENVNLISPTSEIVELENGFSAVRYDGDYGFDEFLAGGGASSDGEVAGYLADNLLSDLNLGDLLGGIFGCSTIAVQSPEGNALFGRNFDWENCQAMVVESHPENSYASISTVNMDFITQNVGGGIVGMALNLDEVKTLAALYAPLDGMNEAGNVDEALELLGQYDLHSSMGMMIHFAIADSAGRSVAVEYVNNEMTVTETPVLTNFYLAEGEKQGIGTEQSHERYDILMDQLEKTPQMGMEDVRDALDSVSKDNFGEFESTEWSIVMNLSAGEVRYYHRENYNQNYTFRLESR